MAQSKELVSARQVFDSGKFETLIGTRESRDLEYKAELWSLQSADDRFEFAKDLAAMANSALGVVVVGISTITLKGSKDDVVNGFKLVDLSDPRSQKLRTIIDEFIYPQLSVSITAKPYHLDPSQGVIIVEISEGAEAQRPYVVIKTPCGKDLKAGDRGLSDRYVAYPFRNESCTTAYLSRQLVDWARMWTSRSESNASLKSSNAEQGE